MIFRIQIMLYICTQVLNPTNPIGFKYFNDRVSMITEKVAGANSTYEQDSTSEKPIRSVAKAISWRVVGTLDTLVVSYFVLGGEGRFKEASAIALVDFVTKMLLYFAHERVWNKIKWGK